MRLATWPALHAHVAATFGGASLGDDGAIAVVVALPATATAAASAVAIELRPIEVQGASWCKATAIVGSMHHLSPAEMLANNARMTIGAYCTHGGALAIRQTLPLGDLRGADLDEALRTLADLVVFSRRRTAERS